jgi:demethylmenaquinone methyltransferase/2-methoxy-6-polyprenyl-1,4-benzoquinol methylase
MGFIGMTKKSFNHGRKQYPQTKELPVGGEKAVFVRAMFERIAPRYDVLNRCFSFRLDQYWRRVTIDTVAVSAQDTVVDLACGTGDLSELTARTGAQVIGIDFAYNMLIGARQRHIPAILVHADALCTPLPPAWASVVLSGFALRNFVSIPAVVREAARLLKPGGRLAFLEVDTPANFFLRWGHHVYFTQIVPFLGSLLSDRQAYTYLPESISYLPEETELLKIIEAAGFCQATKQQLSGGIAQVVTAIRQDS